MKLRTKKLVSEQQGKEKDSKYLLNDDKKVKELEDWELRWDCEA